MPHAAFLEYTSSSEGVKKLNSFLNQHGGEIVDAFPLVDGSFFVFLSLENTVEGVEGCYRGTQEISKYRGALYHLDFQSIEGSLYCFQSGSLLEMIRVLDACWEKGLSLVEIKKPLSGVGFLRMSGPVGAEVPNGVVEIVEPHSELKKHLNWSE